MSAIEEGPKTMETTRAAMSATTVDCLSRPQLTQDTFESAQMSAEMKVRIGSRLDMCQICCKYFKPPLVYNFVGIGLVCTNCATKKMDDLIEKQLSKDKDDFIETQLSKDKSEVKQVDEASVRPYCIRCGISSNKTYSEINVTTKMCPQCTQKELELSKVDKLEGSTAEIGRKDDNGKPRWDLASFKFFELIVDTVTHGAKEYGPENWKSVENGKERYFAAAMRHISAYRSGELLDKKSGLPHLAHAATNLMFLYELGDIE